MTDWLVCMCWVNDAGQIFWWALITNTNVYTYTLQGSSIGKWDGNVVCVCLALSLSLLRRSTKICDNTLFHRDTKLILYRAEQPHTTLYTHSYTHKLSVWCSCANTHAHTHTHSAAGWLLLKLRGGDLTSNSTPTSQQYTFTHTQHLHQNKFDV